MSIIEQAAKRLEELRRAGVDVPAGTKPREVTTGVTPSSEAETVVELGRPYKKPLVLDPAANRPVRVAPPQARNESSFEQPHRHSRTVEIDLARLADMGYLTPDAPRTQLADEYRVIKRPLLTNALRKSSTSVERGNLILITSAMPGEGKTFTAINLALSMAVELDCTVLLVDADVARPAMLDRLGLPSTKGLLDVLTDPRLDLSDVLLRTNVERLSILPAGTHHPRATELLASDAMNRLVDELATRYSDRILVFDGPPLLASTESRVLAGHMGQIVVVVEADRTQRSTLVQALAAVESCPVVMTLLNKVVSSEAVSYYGYYANAPS
ncbi:MAG TPA: XrtA-associated tyrosine autokinase [Burkholderiaceae bacterium]|nr:XrtA-associated tyrosine autokinase [Burkholderiaceae bacterium]